MKGHVNDEPDLNRSNEPIGDGLFPPRRNDACRGEVHSQPGSYENASTVRIYNKLKAL